MGDRLLVDLGDDGRAAVGIGPGTSARTHVPPVSLNWPLDDTALEDLRWYLEDYLRAPFGVWEDRGPRIQAMLARWGEEVFASVFGSDPARDVYQRAKDLHMELVIRSASPHLLGLPWELMRDPKAPVALELAGMSRALAVANLDATAEVPGDRLRVLMVISRPAETGDVGYRMIARPLVERLGTVRGRVDLTVLRPPTLSALSEALAEAVSAGEPFHVLHFDGHGVMPSRRAVRGRPSGPLTMLNTSSAEGLLAFERPSRGGGEHVSASKFAAVVKEGRVPVVVLNACQSGAEGKDLEASVATHLIREGCASVVAMAYSVYPVAAAEFMASFYECLFAGDTVSEAVAAGRRRLFERDLRPSPRGELPLADWLVPVHYLRSNVSFPQVRAERRAFGPSLDAALDELRSPGARREGGTGNLDPAGAFVGRDDMFYRLEKAAMQQKVMLLHGPGGMGKTELAKAFGRWWRDTGGPDQPEWVLWHSFEPGAASFGLDGVISETGLQIFGTDFARLDPAERKVLLEGLLSERQLLLIWDNFETVRSMPDSTGATTPLDDAECAKVADFLAELQEHGRSIVLITSRTPEDWLGQVCRIELGGLAPEEAAQYARDLLALYPAAAPRQARKAFGELLQWLGGHPLSMRLILPLLEASAPEALLEGLRGTTSLPGEDPSGDRATSLAASINYSFSHLSSETRQLLPAVCLFRGIADVSVLAAFSGAPDVPDRFAGVGGEEWKLALDDAARVGLLSRLGAGMYRVHPALPTFLAARWHAGDPEDHDSVRDAAARALVAAYAGFGRWLSDQIASGNVWFAYAAIGLQRSTLGAMLGYAVDRQLWQAAEAIIRPLNDYWNTHGLDEEAAGWADRVQLATWNRDGSPPGLDSPAGSLWLFTAGAQANRQQATRPSDAARIYRQILDMLQAQPATPEHQVSIAVNSHELGNVALAQGRLEEAEDWYRKSLAISEEQGDRRGMASSYHQLGRVSQDRGWLDQAETWYRKSLAIFGELGDRPGTASCYHHLSMLAQARGRLREAEDWCSRSLAIFMELGDRPHVAHSYVQLGMIDQTLGLVDQAEEWYLRAVAIREELEDRPGLASSYHLLGMIAENQGRLDEAQQWYLKALAMREELGDRPGMALAYHHLGTVAQQRGRLEEAEEWYRRALATFEELGDQPHVATSYHQLGILAQDRGLLEEAEEWYRKSLAINEKLGNRPGMALTLVVRGLLAERLGQQRESMKWMVHGVTLFDEFPHPSTGTGPLDLARLTARLGMDTLEACWREVTGGPLPQTVRDYLTIHQPQAEDQERL